MSGGETRPESEPPAPQLSEMSIGKTVSPSTAIPTRGNARCSRPADPGRFVSICTRASGRPGPELRSKGKGRTNRSPAALVLLPVDPPAWPLEIPGAQVGCCVTADLRYNRRSCVLSANSPQSHRINRSPCLSTRLNHS